MIRLQSLGYAGGDCRISIRALAALALLAGSTGAQSAPLQPTGKWVVHFDDSQCLAERNYGPKEHSLFLALKQPALGDVIQMDVVERGRTESATQLNGRVEFDDQAPLKATVLRYMPSQSDFRVHMINLPRGQLAAAGKAKTLHFRTSGMDETFALDSLEQLLRVMDRCAADLRAFWNVKSSQQDESVVREDATGRLRGLISADDYPWESLFNGDAGAVKTVLLIDEEGKVADCSVIETSGAAMLDAQTCAILKRRARFTPAVGKDGKPAKDAWIQKINWKVGS